MHIPKLDKRGFSLMELLGVVAIIAIIAAIAISSSRGMLRAGQESKIQAELQRLNTAAQQYKSVGGRFVLSDANRPDIAALEAVEALKQPYSWLGAGSEELKPMLIEGISPTTDVEGETYDLCYAEPGGFYYAPRSANSLDANTAGVAYEAGKIRGSEGSGGTGGSGGGSGGSGGSGGTGGSGGSGPGSLDPFADYRPIAAMMQDYGVSTLPELASKLGFADTVTPLVPDTGLLLTEVANGEVPMYADTDLFLEQISGGNFTNWDDYVADAGFASVADFLTSNGWGSLDEAALASGAYTLGSGFASWEEFAAYRGFASVADFIADQGWSSLNDEATNRMLYTPESVAASTPDYERLYRNYAVSSLDELATNWNYPDTAALFADYGVDSADDFVRGAGFFALNPEGDINAALAAYVATSADSLATRHGYQGLRSATDEEFAAMFAPSELLNDTEAIGLIHAFGTDARIGDYNLALVNFGARNSISSGIDFSNTNVTGTQLNDIHYFLDVKLENMDLSGMDFTAGPVDADGTVHPGFVSIGAGTSFRNSTGLTVEKLALATIMGTPGHEVDLRGTGITREALEAARIDAGGTVDIWFDTAHMLFD